MGKKKGKPRPEGPACPFCGRRKSVKRLEDGLCWCDHCQRMFEG